MEALLLILLGAFSAASLLLSGDYNPTAALFPRWVAAASVAVLFLAFAFEVANRPKPSGALNEEGVPEVGSTTLRWTSVLAWQAGYLVGIYLVGFTAATLLYLLVAPVLLGYRAWRIIAFQAIGLTVLIVGSFTWFFHVRLPKGMMWGWF